MPFQDEKRNTEDHGSEFSKEVGGKEQEMAAIEAEEETQDIPALTVRGKLTNEWAALIPVCVALQINRI